jgi:4-aminobutyrate aminotransferase-like enzyme
MKNHAIPGDKAKALLERDSKVISQSYPRAYPFMMDHGSGSEVWDVDGNRYIDFASGIAVNSTGHCHPSVVKAIQDQATRFTHISSDFYHPVWIEFSERVAATAPAIYRFLWRIPRSHHGRAGIHGQQTGLPTRFLTAYEWRDTRTVSLYLSARFGAAAW